MPEDDRERLFSWESRGAESGGFGLYFVQTIVESYGGIISAEASEPRGTVFRVELPAA